MHRPLLPAEKERFSEWVCWRSRSGLEGRFHGNTRDDTMPARSREGKSTSLCARTRLTCGDGRRERAGMVSALPPGGRLPGAKHPGRGGHHGRPRHRSNPSEPCLMLELALTPQKRGCRRVDLLRHLRRRPWIDRPGREQPQIQWKPRARRHNEPTDRSGIGGDNGNLVAARSVDPHDGECGVTVPLPVEDSSEECPRSRCDSGRFSDGEGGADHPESSFALRNVDESEAMRPDDPSSGVARDDDLVRPERQRDGSGEGSLGHAEDQPADGCQRGLIEGSTAKVCLHCCAPITCRPHELELCRAGRLFCCAGAGRRNPWEVHRVLPFGGRRLTRRM